MSELVGEYGRSCVDCRTNGCATASGNYPAFCATAALSDEDKEAMKARYRDPDVRPIMEAAADASRRAFAEQWCRVEETMYFAHRLGARKIGIAVCSGLLAEGRILADVLRGNGFDVYGIACKAGAIPKADFGLQDSCCDYGTVSCDPLLQAQLLNEAGTDLNIVVGLCVGHDILFTQHSNAPATTLVVKDRALCHNPVAALHALGTASPYNRMAHFKPLTEDEPESAGCCC